MLIQHSYQFYSPLEMSLILPRAVQPTSLQKSLGAYALDAKNQYTVTETNKGMEIISRKTNFLTEKTADLAAKSTMDNRVIKWITIVSPFYLPGSFVTVRSGLGTLIWITTDCCRAY